MNKPNQKMKGKQQAEKQENPEKLDVILCQICYHTRRVFKYDACACKYTYCEDCYEKMIEVKISTRMPNDNEKEIKCNCGKVVEMSALIGVLSPYNKERICMELTKKFMQKDDSYHKCVNNSCKSWGFYEGGICKSDVQCQDCQHKWTEASLTPPKSQNQLKDCLSKVRKWISCKKCPKCSSPIQKNGGCQHMNCGYCKFSYCWYCSQDYAKHSPLICIMVLFVKYGIAILSILAYFIYKIWISTMILQYLLIFLLANVFPFSIFLQICIFDGYRRQKTYNRRYNNKWASTLKILAISGLGVLQLGIIALYYYLNILFDIVPLILGFEAASFLTIYTVLFLSRFVIRRLSYCCKKKDKPRVMRYKKLA